MDRLYQFLFCLSTIADIGSVLQQVLSSMGWIKSIIDVHHSSLQWGEYVQPLSSLNLIYNLCFASDHSKVEHGVITLEATKIQQPATGTTCTIK